MPGTSIEQKGKPFMSVSGPIVSAIYSTNFPLRLSISDTNANVFSDREVIDYVSDGLNVLAEVRVRRSAAYTMVVTSDVVGAVFEFYSVGTPALDARLLASEWESSALFHTAVNMSAGCTFGIRVKRGHFVSNNSKLYWEIRQVS